MADPREWPDDNETATRDATVIDFPFSLRTNETDAVPDDVVVMIEENPEGVSSSAGGGVGAATGTETSREGDDTEEEDTTEKDGIPAWLKFGSDVRNEYPRLHALIVGVILPMVLLVGAAILFGQAIVWAESAPELNSNDDLLTEASMANKTLEILTDSANNTLKHCLELRADGKVDQVRTFEDMVENVTNDIVGMRLASLFEEGSALSEIQRTIAPVKSKQISEITSNTLSIVGADILLEHTLDCEKSVEFVFELLLQATPRLRQLSDPEISFHWNQCIRPGPSDFSSNYNPDAQKYYYTEEWVAVRDAYYEQSVGEGALDLAAYRDASRLATIPDGTCEYNTMGASWFWFSVMTTVGYGDVVPQTDLGRVFVYTAGFASILIFLGVIGNAGRVTNLLVDDLMQQMSYDWLTAAPLGFIYWCGLYFAWMVLLGKYYTSWNDSNIGVEMDRLEGFWFAFNSMSTIGFGDLGVRVEAFQLTDFIIHAILLIFGLLLLSLGFDKAASAVAVGEGEEGLTLKERLDGNPMVKSTEDSTLGNGEEAVSDSPGPEDIATLQGSQAPGLSVSPSVQTPMETVFTRENRESAAGPSSR